MLYISCDENVLPSPLCSPVFAIKEKRKVSVCKEVCRLLKKYKACSYFSDEFYIRQHVLEWSYRHVLEYFVQKEILPKQIVFYFDTNIKILMGKMRRMRKMLSEKCDLVCLPMEIEELIFSFLF